MTLEPNTIDENFRREKIWIYPYEALRELLIDALAHRDWSRFVDVEMAGYRDRLEIISPGALPNAMTVEKMLAGQRSARNHIIVEVLRDYGYVDARGMGVRTKVIPALKAGGAQSHFDATEDYLKVLVGKASVKTAESITKVSGKTLAAIRDKVEITIPELADIVGVTQRSVEQHLQKIQREGLLKRVGGRKLGYWEVVE